MVIERAAAHDFLYMANYLREEDLVETVLATGRTPREILTPTLSAYTVLDSAGRPLAMFGVEDAHPVEGETENFGHTGRAWFLATPDAEKKAVAILKAAPTALNALSDPYLDGLHALAWSHNYIHLRWAQAVGFKRIGYRFIRGNLFHLIHRPRQPPTP